MKSIHFKYIHSIIASALMIACIMYVGAIADTRTESYLGFLCMIGTYAYWINTRLGKKLLNKLNESFYDDNF